MKIKIFVSRLVIYQQLHEKSLNFNIM